MAEAAEFGIYPYIPFAGALVWNLVREARFYDDLRTRAEAEYLPIPRS